MPSFAPLGGPPQSPPSRTRRFALLGALGLGLVMGGCSGDDAPASAPTTAPVTASTSTTIAPGESVSFQEFDAFSTELKTALTSGEVDVAVLFSTDGEIAANDWVLLEDDQGLQDKENVVPLIRQDAASPPIEAALGGISEALTTAELTELNRRSASEPPPQLVTEWLESQGLLPHAGDPVTGDLIVGSADFTESLLIGEMYAQVLQSAGAEVTRSMRFGSREEVLPSVEAGDLDLVPEYVSSVLRHYQPDVVPPLSLAEVLAEARAAVESVDLSLLDPAPAQDTEGFVVTGDTAERLELTEVSDLAQLSEPLVLGGPPDCPAAVTCLAGLAEVYGVPIEG